MSWNKSGDERAKSYQVYKDLERSYKDLQNRYAELESRLAAKDEAMRLISRELYQALESTMQPEASNRPGLAKAHPATPTAQQTVVHLTATVPRTEREPMALKDILDGMAQKRKEA